MSKAQKLVNKIQAEYGLDTSTLSDNDLDDLSFALQELKELDREDVSPSSLSDDDYDDDSLPEYSEPLFFDEDYDNADED